MVIIYTIHLELQNFCKKDETTYETDRINGENMYEFDNFIAYQKPENTKQKTKYDRQTCCKFCGMENE